MVSEDGCQARSVSKVNWVSSILVKTGRDYDHSVVLHGLTRLWQPVMKQLQKPSYELNLNHSTIAYDPSKKIKRSSTGMITNWSSIRTSSWNRTGEQWQKNPSPYIVLSALLSENPDLANCLLPIGTRMRSTLYSPLPWCCLYSGKTFWWD